MIRKQTVKMKQRRQAALAVMTGGVLLLTGAAFMSGCGSSSGEQPISSASGGNTAATSGRAEVTIRWPERSDSRLIPFASNSIRVRLLSGDKVLGESLLVRPDGGGSSSARFERLPVGPITVTATAFPAADGTGVAQAQATTGAEIIAGQTATIRLTLASTISTITVTPSTSTLAAGQTIQLSATAKNDAGEIVLTSLTTFNWVSKAPTVATVTQSGLVTATNGRGSTKIEATETESGKVGSASIAAPQQDPRDATFQTPQVYSLPGLKSGVIAADFDGDGNVDAVTSTSNKLYILYGRGDGTLEQPKQLLDWPADLGPQCAADIDGNGKLDVVCSENGVRVIVLPSLGSRSYGTPVAVSIGGKPNSICVADLNGDGRLDLASTTPGDSLSGDFYVALNTGGVGQIAFGTPSRLTVMGWSAAISAADWNADGKTDLAVTYGSSIVGQAGVRLFLGNGQGGFTNGMQRATGTQTVLCPVGADINGDGILDMLVSNYWDHNVGFLRGLGGGTFDTIAGLSAPQYPILVRATDLDGDGRLDVVTSNAGTGYITIFSNRGSAIFSSGRQVSSGGQNTRGMDVADFNHDGKPDIILECEGSSTITLLINSTPS